MSEREINDNKGSKELERTHCLSEFRGLNLTQVFENGQKFNKEEGLLDEHGGLHL